MIFPKKADPKTYVNEWNLIQFSICFYPCCFLCRGVNKHLIMIGPDLNSRGD